MARVDQNIEFIHSAAAGPPPLRAPHHLGVRAGSLLCEKVSHQGAAVGRIHELTGTLATEGRKRLL